MQQTYQLSYFEKLIRIDLKSEFQQHKKPDRNYLTAIVDEATKHKDRLIQEFSQQLYNLGKRKRARHVQNHQHQLILLMDLTTEHLDTDDILSRTDAPPNDSWRYLYRFLYKILAEILSFIESQYPQNMDIDCKIPDAYLYLVREGYAAAMMLLQEKSEDGEVESSLIPILIQPFEDFLEIEHPGQFISYSHLHYLTKLSIQIRKILDSSRCEKTITESIEWELHVLNFNSPAYLQYWTDRTSKEIEQLPSSRDRLNRLVYLQKKIAQTRTKPGISLNRLHDSLQNQLLCWLSAEIVYQEKVEVISQSIHSIGELDRWKDFKVQTGFSVPQMGAILKLLFDSGYYLNKNKTELLDFFSFFFTSAKQDAVSSQSLRSHFYKDSAAVSRAVQEILGELLDISQKGINVLCCFIWNLYVFHDFLPLSDWLDLF
ncbi:hypothetical protein DVR12_20345 [Chitinophaga silvatica]|uniref:Uncharacterized protein n=1 Tax=Chitinophaga silvatica TaxID=2282649 RepID=A0A3E1Y5T2_9BACT|nr:hypothetical protein [Chitinophaga silvatica]RFS20072.1 hypothetical protein DVR12_20345 [Chitinophaga silvatica]